MSGPNTYVVVDIETACYMDGEGKWRSEPWFVNANDQSPYGILFGHMSGHLTGDAVPGIFINDELALGIVAAGDVLVGHNIKFDASHAPELRAHPAVWDTMIAEYILTAQLAQFASLKSLGEKYAPTAAPKGDLIASNLASGIPPQELSREELGEYLVNDLELTAAVFKCQWALATPQQKALIFVQSAASLVYGRIEANGLALDVSYTIAARDHADNMAARAIGMMRSIVESLVGRSVAEDLTRAEFLMTPTFLSMMLFGSPRDHKVLVPLTDAEKLAAPKRRVNRAVKFVAPPGGVYTAVVPATVGSTVRGSVWGTDDNVLEKIIQSCSGVPVAIAQTVREYRTWAKLSKTYYTAWLEQIEGYADRRLHPKIHSTATNTGRTSSASPNVQNIPDAARACVISRHVGGQLLEMDFRQLEVVGLAQVSKCPALITALARGDDIHYLSGKRVFGWKTPAEMDKEKRRVVKTINFGLIYGGSAAVLAEQAGVPEDVARQLINAFYQAFPGVKQWQMDTIKKVTDNPDGRRVIPGPNGTTCIHELTTPTGRTYAFPLEVAKWQLAAPNRINGTHRPSPTKVKNYPVQGFATGDVVPLAVMLVQRTLDKHAPDVELVNVVHDSMLFDLPPGWSPTIVEDFVEDVIDHALPAALKQLWGIDMVVPLSVEFSQPSTTWKAR